MKTGIILCLTAALCMLLAFSASADVANPGEDDDELECECSSPGSGVAGGGLLHLGLSSLD